MKDCRKGPNKSRETSGGKGWGGEEGEGGEEASLYSISYARCEDTGGITSSFLPCSDSPSPVSLTWSPVFTWTCRWSHGSLVAGGREAAKRPRVCGVSDLRVGRRGRRGWTKPGLLGGIERGRADVSHFGCLICYASSDTRRVTLTSASHDNYKKRFTSAHACLTTPGDHNKDYKS